MLPLMAGCWNKRILKVQSNPNHSVILLFFCLVCKVASCHYRVPGERKIKNLFRHLFLFFLPLYEVLLHEREQNDSLLSAKWKAVILRTSSLWNGTDEVGNTKSLKAHGFYSTISGREEGFMQNCSLKRGQIGRQSFPVKKALIMWQQCLPSTLWRSTRVQGILKYLLSQ